jgi:antirestriction protein
MTLEKTQAIVENNKGEEIDKPSIYIACLSAYNSGRLHGSWIVPKTTEEELLKQVEEVLKSSPMPDAEEWAIHDYNNFPNLGEYPSSKKIVETQKAIEQYGIKVVQGFIEIFGDGQDLEKIDEAYHGEWDSFKDFACDNADELMNIPEHISSYFDYEKYERDLSMDYAEAEADGYKVHIFNKNW